MQGNGDFNSVRFMLEQGWHALRTGWQATGQVIRQGAGPADFVLVSIDGTEQPWSKPSDDLLARDWIVRSPPPPPADPQPEQAA